MSPSCVGTFLETTLDRVSAGFVLDGPLAAMGDEDSNDPFCRWVESLTG